MKSRILDWLFGALLVVGVVYFVNGRKGVDESRLEGNVWRVAVEGMT